MLLFKKNSSKNASVIVDSFTKRFTWRLASLIFTFISLILISFQAFSAAVELVADINTDGSGYPSFPANFTEFNGKLYFEADNGTSGRELFVYDGSNPPSLVDDIRSGTGGSIPKYLTVFNGKLYFQANNGVNGVELYVYDGSNLPSLVADIFSGSVGSTPKYLTVFNGELYFSANDGVKGIELYKYDGSTTPSLVADIYSGATSSTPEYLTIFNNKLYFSADDGVNGTELYEYDGSTSPNIAVDIVSGANPSYPDSLTVLNNKLYFVAFGSGYELFEYDGINPPASVAGTNNANFLTAFNNELYFNVYGASVGYELYKYDGNNPVSLVYDINSGLSDSNPANLKVFNSKLYFSADDGTNGIELFEYDGSAQPSLVADINSGPNNSNPTHLAVFNNKFYFQADSDNNNEELYEYDGTNPPSLTADINGDTAASYPQYFTEFNGKLYFSADDGNHGKELFEYDGITSSSLVADIRGGSSPSDPTYLTVFNNKLYFSANDGTNGFELFEYDGTNSPSLVADIRSGTSGSYPKYLTVFNNKLYFQADDTAGIELYEYDGTGSPTLVDDIYTGVNGSSPTHLTVFNNKLYFSADDGTSGTELYEYDGTSSPTLVADINSGSSASSPSYLTVFNNKLYFQADDGINGEELYEYDGVNPPSLKADIYSGSQNSYPSYLTVFDGKLYFQADDGTNGAELYEYDGTNPPSLVADIKSGSGSSFLAYLTVFDNRLYFQANDGVNGTELYKYDGSSLPILVTDLNNGSAGSYPIYLTVFNGKLYFQATDGKFGQELYVANPNTAPTISGSPSTSISENASYTFTPTANDIDGDNLTFSIVNKPNWASFSTSTGRLSGTPGTNSADAYNNIVISVSDRSLSADLSSFNISVSAYYNADFDNDGLTNAQEDALGTNIYDKDTDHDNVEDAQDAFPLDGSESVDTDNDGIGNNADTDDDNDGILDVDDSAPLDDTVGDSQAPVIGEVLPLTVEATGELTELSLIAPEVIDNNIYPATIIANYSEALALGEHVITWIATDYAGNQSTAEQLVTIVDTTGPIFDDLSLLTVNSQGRLTDISLEVVIGAMDLVDGELPATFIGKTKYTSGYYDVELVVVDNSNNSTTSYLPIEILPEASLPSSKPVAAGGVYELDIILSGQAANYPVELTYQFNVNGENIEQATVSISEGIKGEFSLVIPADITVNDDVSVLLTGATHSFVGNSNQVQFSIIDYNVAPLLDIDLMQNGQEVSVIDPDNGIATLIATIEDVNWQDSHDISWSTSESNLTDVSNSLTYEFDPSQFVEGVYRLNITVTENNTAEAFSVSQTGLIVVEQLAELASDLDSDNDGLTDSEEGYGDSDGDGIADYLDDDANPTRLVIGDNIAPLQTSPGLEVSLGSLARIANGAASQYANLSSENLAEFVGAGAANTEDHHFEAISPLFSFVISDLAAQGDSVAVIIPLALGTSLPAGAVYRKYNTRDGWFDFVEDASNNINSSMIDEHGNCPPVNDVSYSRGLSKGNNCIQLVIEDGGSNDTDFMVNGSVEDPGVIVVEKQNQAPAIDLQASNNVDEETEITLDASGTTDAEGDNLSYHWVQISGIAVEIIEATNAQLTFTSPSVTSNEILIFEITVDDGRDSSSATTQVTVCQVNKSPLIVINSHISSIEEGKIITLTSQGIDPDDDDTLSYSWQQISGPSISFNNANASQVSLTLPEVTQDEMIVVQVTVSDGDLIAVATINLTVTNKSSSGGGMFWLLLLAVIVRLKLPKRLLQAT